MDKQISIDSEKYRKSKISEYCSIMEKDIQKLPSETADALERYVSSLIQNNSDTMDLMSGMCNLFKAERELFSSKSVLLSIYIRQMDSTIETDIR